MYVWVSACGKAKLVGEDFALTSDLLTRTF